MNIGKLINKDGEKYSPYMSGLVNHLPMGQFALYKLTNSIQRVEDYTDYYLKRSSIDQVKTEYKQVNSLEDCLGNRSLYESCLDLIRRKLENQDLEELVSEVLDKYTLGLSSGLFHTTIRLAYAIEGYRLDGELQAEVERALAYYVTAYRSGDIFKRRILKENARKSMIELMENPQVKKIRNSNMSLGHKLKAFYENEEFLREGFIIEGNEEDKVKGILEILIPAFYNSNNIVMLHTITGLHAVTVLKDYFEDYDRALDILTTTAIAHILTQDDLDITKEDINVDIDWESLMKQVSNSKDVHTLKIGYTSRELNKKFKIEDLKYGLYKRIKRER